MSIVVQLTLGFGILSVGEATVVLALTRRECYT